jgi:hypothetical protein
MTNMKSRWFLIFATLLVLQGALPRLHCLCHNNEVLLITAAVMDCCHAEHARTGTSMTSTDLSCFRNADSQALGGVNWSPNSPEIIVAVASLPLALLMVTAEFLGSTANATRGPPFLTEHLIGLYLLHGVLLT